MKINFYEFKNICDEELKFAVIMARYKNKWIFVRHRERATWEIPGGHREEKEAINSTASRELYEETGAVDFKITPVCVYSVRRDVNDAVAYSESYGGLFFAEVNGLNSLPVSEIGEIKLFDDLPMELTYPLIQPHLYNRIEKFLK